MERKIYSGCSLTHRKCSSEDCPGYVGTGYSCLYTSLVTENVQPLKPKAYRHSNKLSSGQDGIIYSGNNGGSYEI